MAPPLTGKTIVVTRPRGQAESLARSIEAEGGKVIRFPLLEISPADDPAPLAAAIRDLHRFSLAIFISPNAVDYSLPAILAAGGWPATLRPAAVGQGTLRSLASYGIGHCLAPAERFDSETLLALPELAAEHVSGRRIVLFKGEGGRDLLADKLMARGATVLPAPCYKRLPPSSGAHPLLTAWQAGQLDAITLSSSEGLRHLLGLLDDSGREFLSRTPIFVPHHRILEESRRLGVSKVILTAAADAGILAGLCQYDWTDQSGRSS